MTEEQEIAKREGETKKLEICIETCEHLNLDINQEDSVLFPPIWIASIGEDKREVRINDLYYLYEAEARCNITGKTCALYNSFNPICLDLSDMRSRCPAFVPASISYEVVGEYARDRKSGGFATSIKAKQATSE